jgi:hypothetical protein
MRNSNYEGNVDHISEMAIVDTFTRLIFADEGEFSPQEESIIAAFRTVDPNVLQDSYSDMGDYLRALGVREMIHLVSRIREHILCEIKLAMNRSADAHVRKDGAGGRTTH